MTRFMAKATCLWYFILLPCCFNNDAPVLAFKRILLNADHKLCLFAFSRMASQQGCVSKTCVSSLPLDGHRQLSRDLCGNRIDQGWRNPSLQSASQREGLQQEDHETLQAGQQSATGEILKHPTNVNDILNK